MRKKITDIKELELEEFYVCEFPKNLTAVYAGTNYIFKVINIMPGRGEFEIQVVSDNDTSDRRHETGLKLLMALDIDGKHCSIYKL